MLYREFLILLDVGTKTISLCKIDRDGSCSGHIGGSVIISTWHSEDDAREEFELLRIVLHDPAYRFVDTTAA